MSAEEVVELVRAFEVGRPDSLVVVIPKSIRERMRIEKGTRFYMKVDRKGRLIYEPMKATGLLQGPRPIPEKAGREK